MAEVPMKIHLTTAAPTLFTGFGEDWEANASGASKQSCASRKCHKSACCGAFYDMDAKDGFSRGQDIYVSGPLRRSKWTW